MTQAVLHRSITAASAEAAGAVPREAIPTICFPFSGGTIGGSHVSAAKLIQALDRSRFRPLVVLHRAEGQLPDFLHSEGLPFETLQVPSFLGTSWGLDREWDAAEALRGAAALPSLVRYLRKRSVRIVHTNDSAMHLTWLLPARLAGARLLWHHRAGPEARGMRFAAPLFADRVAAVSRFSLSQAGRRVRNKAEVIYSPFDAMLDVPDRERAHDALTRDLGLDPSTRLIGFFGNIVGRKRPLAFVEMIAELRALAPTQPIAGLMFGATLDHDLEQQVRDRAEQLGLGRSFHFMGFRRPSSPLLAGCDVHAVTAVDEPFGRSLIEAMLLGTPVVAAASGGNIEAIEDGVTGFLVRADDPGAMARGIAALLAAPDRARTISAAARAHATGSFGIQCHAAQVSALYDSMLGEVQA
jgi:glycosyltransferase involved in cell wall biosynthesis